MINEPFLSPDDVCSTTLDFINSTEKVQYKQDQKFLQTYKDGLYIESPIEYKLNRLGYRCSYSDIPDTEYILVLGCSHTFGQGIHEEHRYSNLLESYYKIPVLNISFPGAARNFVRDNLIQLFTSNHRLPKLVIIQWPSKFRLTINYKFLGPWTVRRKENKWFSEAHSCVENYSRTAKQQGVKLLEKFDIPYIEFDIKNPDDDFIIDVARDNDHGGIESNRKVSDYIIEKIDATPRLKKLFCRRLNTRYKNRQRVYRCNDYIYKEWIKDIRKKWTYTKLLDTIELVQQVDPTYILDHGEDNDVIWAKMRLIKGETGFNREWDDKFVKTIVNFIINHYETFYPIYHGDPSLSNILISNDILHYIDYDDIAICENKKEVFAHIQEKCIESFKRKPTNFDVIQLIKDLTNVYR
jgi:hypothetical protein